jgi:hypothetical protein
VRNILSVAERDVSIVGFRNSTIRLSMGTQIIEDAFLYPDLTRTLLGYRDP